MEKILYIKNHPNHFIGIGKILMEIMIMIEKDNDIEPLYMCCHCEKEIKFNDIRVEIPELNEVWCPECFYEEHKIIK